MPVISTFFGIIVRVYHADHPPPHFHVQYGEYMAVIEAKTGRLLGGKLPPRPLRLVQQWRRGRLAEILRAWQDAQDMRQPRRIAGLD